MAVSECTKLEKWHNLGAERLGAEGEGGDGRFVFEQPILNSPYEVPRFHHALDEYGQPLDVPPVEGRRRSEIITPVPMPRMQTRQGALPLGDRDGPSAGEQEYNPTPIINEIRGHVASWRALPYAADWGVTATTKRLLTYWRSHPFSGVRPFFCQIEAVETIIWLTEVACRFRRSRPGVTG
jgi:type III restriction enzyme